MGAFYAVCFQCVQALLAEHHASLPPGLLTEAFALNQLHFHLDLKPGPFTMDLHWNLWEYWHGLRQGVPVPLQPASCTYVKDWEGKPFTLRRSDSTVLLPPVSAVAPADRV